jgi:hypothetical protein
MRKYLSMITVCLILFNLGGYYVRFGIMQFSIHQEIKQTIRKNLKDSELTLIVVSDREKSDIRWIENGKEFSLNGEMYDVVRIKIQNGKTSYYCINDVKEEELITSYKKNHKNRESDKNVKNGIMLQFFPKTTSLLIYNFTSILIYPSFIDLYQSRYLEIQSPPPKFSI